jgi:hypothetical protein
MHVLLALALMLEAAAAAGAGLRGRHIACAAPRARLLRR